MAIKHSLLGLLLILSCGIQDPLKSDSKRPSERFVKAFNDAVKTVSEVFRAAESGLSLEELMALKNKYQDKFSGVGTNLEKSVDKIKSDPEIAQKIINFKNMPDKKMPEKPATDWANILEKISQSSEAQQQIMAMIHSPPKDWALFKTIILQAFSTPENRRLFIDALQYANCLEENNPWVGQLGFYDCPPWFAWQQQSNPLLASLREFENTELKKLISKLQKTLQSFGKPEDDLSWFKDDHWEPLFGLMIALEPHVTRVLVGFAESLSKEDLKNITEDLARLLKHPILANSKITTDLRPKVRELFEAGFKEFSGYDWNHLTEEQLRDVLYKFSNFLARMKAMI